MVNTLYEYATGLDVGREEGAIAIFVPTRPPEADQAFQAKIQTMKNPEKHPIKYHLNIINN